MAESATNTAKRLITFGCSHTVGEYLPGWYHVHPELRLSNLAWPFVLAHTMNVPVINTASGGASNHEILLKILSFNYEPGDYVAVCWTYAGREMIYEPKAINSLHRTMDLLDKYQDMRFYNIHTLHDLEMRSREYVQHAKLFLTNSSIPCIMSRIEQWNEANDNWQDYSYNDLPMFDIVDRAEDNLHPGIESHRLFADKLYNWIK